MNFSLSLVFFFISTFSFAQNLDEFIQIDKFKIDDLTVKVFFKDPMVEIFNSNPNFDSKDDKEKHNILANYLKNNTLYVFQTYKKLKIVKSYNLKGNPKSVKEINPFKLEIYDSKNLTTTIDIVNIRGKFFENMIFFQSPETKNLVGQGAKIWGYFVLVKPYLEVKNTISKLIEMDINNSVPINIIEKEEAFIEPLFNYQKCGLDNIKNRTITTTVFMYDELGNIKNESTREEMDSTLYYSSISKDLGSVTAFPYFSKNDSILKYGDSVRVYSQQENIKHYLKDINVYFDSTSVSRIEAKLIIHGYSRDGHHTRDEIYIAEFEEIENCTLPKTIKFYNINDKELLRPRIIMEINYKMKSK